MNLNYIDIPLDYFLIKINNKHIFLRICTKHIKLFVKNHFQKWFWCFDLPWIGVQPASGKFFYHRIRLAKLTICAAYVAQTGPHLLPSRLVPASCRSDPIISSRCEGHTASLCTFVRWRTRIKKLAYIAGWFLIPMPPRPASESSFYLYFIFGDAFGCLWIW